jgi:hypothetical protein
LARSLPLLTLLGPRRVFPAPLGLSPPLLLLELLRGLAGFVADSRRRSILRLRPPSLAPAGAFAAAEIGRQVRMLGKAAVRSSRAPEDDAGLRHRRGDDVGVFRLFRDTLMEQIAPRATSLERRLHRRRCDRKVVEPERCLAGLMSFWPFEPSGHAQVGNDDAIGPFDMRRERSQVSRQ